MTQVFMDNVIKLHGSPTKILSYRDSIFMSKFWSELMQKHGLKLLKSTTFHSQTDVSNKSIEAYLRCVFGQITCKVEFSTTSNFQLLTIHTLHNKEIITTLSEQIMLIYTLSPSSSSLFFIQLLPIYTP